MPQQRFKTIANASLWWAPLLALMLMVSLSQSGWDYRACLTAGLTLICAVWWIFEPIPIPATALIPLGVFPLTGILNGQQVAESYGSSLILLLLGGAMLSKAMEKSGAHRRIALGMVYLLGGNSSRRVVMGFMVAAAFLSMWISNTATTLMLLPVAMAVVEKTRDERLAIPLLLGIAYAASIGGLGTLIGTPPNVVFLKIYQESTQTSVSFVQWMTWALPVVCVLLPLAAIWLTRNLGPADSSITLEHPGPWRREEKRVLTIFALTAVAWMTLKEPFGGWSAWLGLTTANYAAVALTAVVILFIAPDGKGGKLLDWSSAKSIQWGILILFAGGIAIAKAFVVTGISQALGDALSGLTVLPVFLIMLLLCLAVTFLTEITSNTATTTLLMPVLASAALAADMEPALLMVPAALSASCAFMLPVATAPNAIVLSSGRVRVTDMIREGVWLNLFGALVITTIIYFRLSY